MGGGICRNILTILIYACCYGGGSSACQSKQKRITDNGGGSKELLKCPSVTCILHVTGIQHLVFISFSGSVIVKLAQLHGIRNRRLLMPYDSHYRMEDVCNRIPESLADADLDSIGYHRSCYQNFTLNLDR